MDIYPYCLKYLHDSWRGQASEGLNIHDWVQELSGKWLEAARDCVVRKASANMGERKKYYDKDSCYIPGLTALLVDIWEKP